MDSFGIFLLIMVGVYIFARIANFAEDSKRRAIMDELERRRQNRIKSLYGRDDEREM